MTATQTPVDQKVGLFLVSYAIGGAALAAPLLEATLTVDTPRESITGVSQVTQTTSPPLDLASRLTGDFTYMTVMPQQTHILVTATGYPQLKWPAHGGVGPALMANLSLRMVLEADWSGGTANYSYLDQQGEWRSVANAPVRAVRG